MKKYLVILCLLFSINQANATQWIPNDNSESPYFEISGGNVEGFKLLDTHVNVEINGIIANITILQNYSNTGNKTIDAKYLFPSSTRAAVHSLQIQINERIIKAVIKRKQQAREEYHQAIQEGKTAVLLEQQRPNLFSFSAGNILPGDNIKLEMKYTEYLSSFEGLYDFYFPIIVGPRYATGDNLNELQNLGEPLNSEKVSISINLQSNSDIYGPAINWLGSIDNLGNNIKISALQKSNYKSDFRLSFRLSNLEYSASVLTYQEGSENYFLAMVHPPRAYSENDILPQDYIFVMDVSGSMAGKPLAQSKKLIKNLLNKMRTEDRFNIVQFAGGSTTLFRNNEKASKRKISQALNFVETPKGGGGTAVLPALEKAFTLIDKKNINRATNVVVITDGLVYVEREVFDLVRKYRDKANVFAFGTGVYGSNNYLFEGIAHSAGTVPFIISEDNDERYLKEFSQYLSTPLLTNLKMKVNGLEIYDTYPQQLQDIYSQRPLVVLGKYRGELPNYFEFSGTSSNGLWQVQAKTNPVSFGTTEAVKFLWAREKIRLLDDYQNLLESPETEEIITELGLKYSLLTRYTSFLAVDQHARADTRDELLVISGQRISSGAADDDMDIEAVKLVDDNRVFTRFWSLDQGKWLNQCDANMEVYMGTNTEQWKLLKDELPIDFVINDVICLSKVLIKISPDSSQTLELLVWLWIEETIFE